MRLNIRVSSSSSGGGSNRSSSSSSKSLLCCGVDAVVPAVYPVSVVGLDAAAAVHPYNVELEGNSTAV